MAVFAVCEDRRCGFNQYLRDLRGLPETCPICGEHLLIACPSCQALLRSRSGRCANCGKSVQTITRATPRPLIPTMGKTARGVPPVS